MWYSFENMGVWFNLDGLLCFKGDILLDTFNHVTALDCHSLLCDCKVIYITNQSFRIYAVIGFVFFKYLKKSSLLRVEWFTLLLDCLCWLQLVTHCHTVCVSILHVLLTSSFVQSHSQRVLAFKSKNLLRRTLMRRWLVCRPFWNHIKVDNIWVKVQTFSWQFVEILLLGLQFIVVEFDVAFVRHVEYLTLCVFWNIYVRWIKQSKFISLSRQRISSKWSLEHRSLNSIEPLLGLEWRQIFRTLFFEELNWAVLLAVRINTFFAQWVVVIDLRFEVIASGVRKQD